MTCKRMSCWIILTIQIVLSLAREHVNAFNKHLPFSVFRVFYYRAGMVTLNKVLMFCNNYIYYFKSFYWFVHFHIILEYLCENFALFMFLMYPVFEFCNEILWWILIKIDEIQNIVILCSPVWWWRIHQFDSSLSLFPKTFLMIILNWWKWNNKSQPAKWIWFPSKIPTWLR